MAAHHTSDTTLLNQLSLPQKALVFDLDVLYARLQTIPDHRDRRGVQSPLASLLMIGVLAKLASQDSGRAMAHWAKLRSQELSQLFHLKRENAPKRLTQVDLRGVVGSFDAMFDQRDLSIQIVQAKGDYLWTVKGNQEGLREDIDVLFQPHRKLAGTSAPPNDFRTARIVKKGHGRLEKRMITVSSPAFRLQHVAGTGPGLQTGKPEN